MFAIDARLKRVDALVRAVRLVRSARLRARRRDRRRRIDAYLCDHSVRKLQLGAGSNLRDGWLNTDVYDERRRNEVVYLDVTKRFPLPEASIDVIFTEHMIEHIEYAAAKRCLAECARVLRPGGKIRVATPSMERIVALTTASGELEQRYVHWAVATWIPDADAPLGAFAINNMFRNWGHKFLYDRQALQHALESAGFADICEFGVGESRHPDLVGMEHHSNVIPPEFNELETLVLEATRP